MGDEFDNSQWETEGGFVPLPPLQDETPITANNPNEYKADMYV